MIEGTQLQNEERSRNLHTKLVGNKTRLNILIKICVSQARISCLSTSKYVFVFNPHITTAENRRPSKEAKERVNPISYAGGGPQTDDRPKAEKWKWEELLWKIGTVRKYDVSQDLGICA